MSTSQGGRPIAVTLEYLCQVEAERDELRHRVDKLETALTLTQTSREHNRKRALDAQAERDGAQTQRDRAIAVNGELLDKAREARDGQLAALDELDAMRRDRDACRVALKVVGEQRDTARAELERRPRLPVTDDEVRAWYADRNLAMSCGPAVLFAALRKDSSQPEGES